jgi:hypothetical protein
MAFGEMDTKRQRAASPQPMSLQELRKMTAVLCDKTKEIIHDYRELHEATAAMTAKYSKANLYATYRIPCAIINRDWNLEAWFLHTMPHRRDCRSPSESVSGQSCSRSTLCALAILLATRSQNCRCRMQRFSYSEIARVIFPQGPDVTTAGRAI